MGRLNIVGTNHKVLAISVGYLRNRKKSIISHPLCLFLVSSLLPVQSAAPPDRISPSLLLCMLVQEPTPHRSPRPRRVCAAACKSSVASTRTPCCLQVAGRLDPSRPRCRLHLAGRLDPGRVRAAACMSSVASTPSPLHYRLHIAGCLDPSAPELPPAYRHLPTQFRCIVRWFVSFFLCFVGPSCTQNNGVVAIYFTKGIVIIQ